MNPADLIRNIRDNFTKRLQRKTGWGKNEVAIELDLAISEESLKALESMTTEQHGGK